jgi:O-acetyl-ADP-ribose deacetylase (regulator of RNase III)
MIEEREGDLLDADVEALVNTVNTVGVMGKGIALQFKKAYPGLFREYLEACKTDRVKIGKMLIYQNSPVSNPKFIINFPTKRHWSEKSDLKYIREGLKDLVDVIISKNIQSIALPPLGCGYGGLNWVDVLPLIQHSFKNLPGIKVLVYPPKDGPKRYQKFMVR